jgi:GNAT superfamily N-acetyltransferase
VSESPSGATRPEVRVTPVRTDRERLALLEFPWKVYRDDPYWVPPLLSERKEFTDPRKNPFFEHARVQFFLGWRGDEIVGTIGAFTNHLYNEFHETNVAWFGFFEVLPDPQAAEALLKAAADWARQQGHTAILGPAQFSTNDEVGMLVEGFDDRPRILMTYNPRRYLDYMDAAGFHKAMDLLAYTTNLDDIQARGGFPPKLVRVVDKLRDRSQIHLRRLRLREFDKELEIVKVIYNQSWERNWGFVPMTEAEIARMATQLKPLLDPDLVWAAEVDGRVVGFALNLPDLNVPLYAAYPRPGKPEWITLIQLLWHWKVRREVKWVRAIALGVLPEYRGTGVDAMLYMRTSQEAVRKGYQAVEMSWLLETNDMVLRSAEMLGGHRYKTYRVYEKTL